MNTETTEQVYEFIVTYLSEHDGVGPSQREIAAGCFLAPSAVLRHLDRLEYQQRILRQRRVARSIRLTQGADLPTHMTEK